MKEVKLVEKWLATRSECGFKKDKLYTSEEAIDILGGWECFTRYASTIHRGDKTCLLMQVYCVEGHDWIVTNVKEINK